MISVLAVMAIIAAMLVVTAGPALANGFPTSKQACKDKKQAIKNDQLLPFFDNQGQCIQFIKENF